MIRSWTDLVDRSYSDLCISVRCSGTNFRDHLASFDFAPFVEVTASNAQRSDLDFEHKRYFVCAEHFEEFRRGMPMRTFFRITVSDMDVEIACRDPMAHPAEHDRSMELLRFLVREEEWPWRWTGHSTDPDTGVSSEHRQGVLVVALPPS